VHDEVGDTSVNILHSFLNDAVLYFAAALVHATCLEPVLALKVVDGRQRDANGVPVVAVEVRNGEVATDECRDDL
jgi:hypothetical protein